MKKAWVIFIQVLLKLDDLNFYYKKVVLWYYWSVTTLLFSYDTLENVFKWAFYVCWCRCEINFGYFAASNVFAASNCSNFSTCSIFATFSTKSCLGFSRGVIILTTWFGSKQSALLYTFCRKFGPICVRTRIKGNFCQVCIIFIMLNNRWIKKNKKSEKEQPC